MKISVALIVKNESAMIQGCLDSVKEADEIIVVDTGSEDNTVELAKAYTDKVYTDYKWEDNFSKARNHAISKCTGDWIFTIDADDRLSPGSMGKMRESIKKYPNELALNVKYKANVGVGGHDIPCLYQNNPAVFWRGAAHNSLSVVATKDSGAVTIYGYSPAHKLDPDRTLRILKKAVDEDASKPRELFYLAREYKYRSNWITALYWYERYLKIATWGPEIADAYLMKAHCLWQLQRGEEAREACLKAININTNFKEAILFLANMVGPINKENWLFLAEIADDSKILFTRGKAEKPASYYETIYEKAPDGEKRYEDIYKEVSQMVGSRSMIDIGCGQGKLSEYIADYDGFDMVKNPYLVADIYTHDYGDYDVYVLLEVLEHLTKDIDVLQKIPHGKQVVFSVPSFDDPSHVRMFTENILRWRYRNIINILSVTRFNWDNKTRKWKTDFPATPSYILLCRGLKI